MERIPLLNCNANSEDIESLPERLLLKTTVNKKAEPVVSGTGFAQTMAGYWSCRYVNNKAPFDVLFDHFMPNLIIGIEVKKQIHNPFKNRQLYVELSNGTSETWNFIENDCGCEREEVSRLVKAGENTDRVAGLIGDSLLRSLMSRWKNYSIGKFCDYADKVNIDHSKIVIGQVYRDRDKKRLCKIFTVPLTAFPQPGDLYWSFPTAQSKSLVGVDDQGRTIYQWYWKDNGQGKYYPSLDDVIYDSVEFPLHTERLEAVVSALRKKPGVEGAKGVLECIERSYDSLGERQASAMLAVLVQERPLDFAKCYFASRTSA